MLPASRFRQVLGPRRHGRARPTPTWTLVLLGALLLAGLLPGAERVASAQPARPPSGSRLVAGTPLGLHVVRPGESLFAVAHRYGLTVSELALLNGTRRDGILLPGRSLVVPLAIGVNARAGSPAVGARAAASPTPAAGASVPTHVVQPGDTLLALASRYHLSIDDLRRWNGLPADGLIHVDEVLKLGERPAEEAGNSGPPVGEPTAAPATTLPGGAREERVLVASGDTLSSLATAYHTSANALMRLNDLEGDFLSVGQELKVPRAGQGPDQATGAKRIEVDVGEQRMYVWQGDTLVWNLTVSTGLASHPTRTGTFAVQSKVPEAWSTPWQLAMPHWLGIYWAGGSENGIHALPVLNGQRIWAANLGSPISYGCVVLDTDDALKLYDWAEVGTPVVIHD
jgi:LysM repeat protein